MKNGDEELEQEIEELNDEIEKYNELIEGEEQLDDLGIKKEESTNEEKMSEAIEMLDDIEEVNDKQEDQMETNSSQSTEKSELSNKKKKNHILTIIIIVLILLIISSGVLLISKLSSNKKIAYKSIDDYTEEEKEIIGFGTEAKKNEIEKEIDNIKKAEEKKKEQLLYTQDYIHYEQLSDEEEKMEIIPSKEKVSIEVLKDIEEEIEEAEEIPAKYNIDEEIEKTEEIPTEKNNEEEKKEIEIPTKYNINDIKKLKMDDQGGFGLCWAFASLESMETHYLVKNNEQIDLSELALDFLSSNKLFGTRLLHQGGDIGIVASEGNIKGVRKEKDGEYRQELLNNTSDPIEFLDEQEQTYYLTDFVDFPTIYKENGIANVSDEDLSEYRNLIKRHILTNGSLYVSVNDEVLNRHTNIFFSSNGRDTHAVSVVGWDDNYSKDNFKDFSSDDSTKKPIHDGAYIIKNSWGDGFGDNGYYYVSYDDQTIESHMTGVLSMSQNSKIYLSDMPNYLINIIRKYYGYTIKQDENGEYVFKSILKLIKDITITEEDNISDEVFKLLVKYLPSVSSVSIDNANITDISPISELNNLQAIRISNTPSITDFSPIGNKKHLASLDLTNNGITDISFISDLNEISFLNLSDNNITDITPISGKTKLRTLHLNNNNINDVSILKEMNIDSIFLSGNKGITGYGELSNVGYIELSDCGLDNIENIHAFSYIDISNNNITTIPEIIINQTTDDIPLIINASGNNISNLSGLNKNFKYQSIDLSNNQISDISSFNDINVRNLNLSNNNIKETSKFDNKNVLNLMLSGNKDIKITKELNSIQTMELNNCNISSLNDLKDLDNTMSLSIKDNNIKSLEGLDKLNKLSYLDLSNNKISTLKNTPKSSVRTIVLTGNDIKTLEDISNIKNLTTLYLNDNKNINDLNQLKNLENLKWIYLNNIGEVDVSILSEVLDNTKDLSISLMNNTLKGKIIGAGDILNISNSKYDNLDINYSRFKDINMRNSTGEIEYEKLFNYKSSSDHLTIYLGERKISYDTVKNNTDNESLTVFGGIVDYKINFNNNNHILENREERLLFIRSFANNQLNDIDINNQFNTITKTGDNPYMIPRTDHMIGFNDLKYNIIDGNTMEDLESSFFSKFIKLPIKSFFKSIFG